MAASERRYSREQTALVLGRLVEHQAEALPAHELTRAELARVVDEAGLDVGELDRVLAELETAEKRHARRFGMRLHVVAQRRVRAQLDPRTLDATLALLERSVGVLGEHRRSDEPASLTWFGRQIAVTVIASRDEVEIQLEERFLQTTQSSLGLVAFSAVPAAALTTVVAGPLAWLLGGVPLLAYASARTIHARRVAATEHRLEQLADQLAELIRERGQLKLPNSSDRRG